MPGDSELVASCTHSYVYVPNIYAYVSVCFFLKKAHLNFCLCILFGRLCTSKVCTADSHLVLCIFKCFTLWNFYAHPPYRRCSSLSNSKRRGKMKSCTDKRESIPLIQLSQDLFFYLVFRLPFQVTFLKTTSIMLILQHKYTKYMSFSSSPSSVFGFSYRFQNCFFSLSIGNVMVFDS